MIPWIQLGIAKIPDNGGELELTQRDKEFSIHLKGVRGELMNSRMHSSEVALSDLGCAHIKNRENCKVLVGGMGMGFTLAAALKATTESSTVVVAELVPDVIEWNKGPLGECAGRPLDNKRVVVKLGDIAELFKATSDLESQEEYDAILLDVDNGPEGFTHGDNDNLYSLNSLASIRKTLKSDGVLAVWSAWHDPKFTTQLKKSKFKVETKTVRAHNGKGSKHTIYLAKKV